MLDLDKLIGQIERKRERERADDRAIAEAVGMTIEEFDADTTAPDPRPDED